MGSKLEEAKEHLKAADKALKTSLLKWKPDYDSAADEYTQAAQCYKIARDLNNAKNCFMKACEFYQKNGSFYHAAKSIENAVIVTKELSPPEELYNMAQSSCRLYQQHGSGDAGANILDKTAKIIEGRSDELAMELFKKAADVSSTESSQHQAVEYISKASRVAVKLGKYDEAVDCLGREIAYNMECGNHGNVGRLTVALVLVHLARGDPIAAAKAYKEWGGSCEMPEIETVDQLLAAFDEEDPDSARRALSSPFIKHMDVEYARLAQTIPLPEVLQVPGKPAESALGSSTFAASASPADDEMHSSDATAHDYSNNPGLEPKDEEGGGLC